MKHTSVYCTAPFNGLTIREDGHVRTCCAGQTSLGNLNNGSIYDIEQSPILDKIKQNMLSNQHDYDNCKDCIDKENKNGLASLRQHYLKFYPAFDESNLTLKFIDIRWNNSCNLGCLYCSPTFSSVWANRLNVEKKLSPVRSYQDELLAWILERIDHVSEIMLVGGEPMLMKQNYALLSRLPQDCKISIITNLSYDLKNLPCWPDLLKRPRDNIAWNISLENIGKKFEYVRSGANWEQVEQNLLLLKQHWPETISLNMVHNLFSAFDLKETIEYFHSIGIKKFNLFPVGLNDQINLANFPRSLRVKSAQQLQQAKDRHLELLHIEDRDLYPFNGSDEIINSLLNNQTDAVITLETFENQINWYDQWGNHKFSDLWSDLNDSIKTQLKI